MNALREEMSGTGLYGRAYTLEACPPETADMPKPAQFPAAFQDPANRLPVQVLSIATHELFQSIF